MGSPEVCRCRVTTIWLGYPVAITEGGQSRGRIRAPSWSGIGQAVTGG
jgi:hypothetical protein